MGKQPRQRRWRSLGTVIFPAFIVADVAHAYEEAMCDDCQNARLCATDHWAEPFPQWETLSRAHKNLLFNRAIDALQDELSVLGNDLLSGINFNLD